MRVALITGATGGLGEVLVKGFDRAGYCCVIHYRSQQKRAIEISKDLMNPCLLVQADLRSSVEVTQMMRSIKGFTSGLDVIINNAGITIDKPLLRFTEAEWDEVIETNLKGVFLLTRESIGLLRPGSHIINISSHAGLRGRRGQAAYSASKAGLIGMSLSMARELAPMGIRVNVVVPGFLPVGMGGRVREALEDARQESLLGCYGSPEELLEFLLFLVSTETVTGQVFQIDSR